MIYCAAFVEQRVFKLQTVQFGSIVAFRVIDTVLLMY